ncbi:MAG: hypothetical protein ACRDPS_21195 [Nocardioides sp.]|uniref:hypothetical protein n=1 Tax=Nocardioides sp. TaxID=35761 RepID=UPI003D6A107A
MADHETFEAFYQDVRGRLLLQTWSLTGDLEAAKGAVRGAMVITWHHWRKVKPMDDFDREDWVRPIAWSKAIRNHSVPLLHRDQTIAPEAHSTLSALRSLPLHDRKVFLLGHLTSVDLAQLAREVGTPISRTETDLQGANAAICDELGIVPEQLQSIFDPLVDVLTEQPWPKTSTITTAGAVRRRVHTGIGAAAAIAALVGTGFFVTQDAETEPRLNTLSMQSAAEEFEVEPSEVPGKKLTAKDLVAEDEVAKIYGGTWAVDITSDNLEGTGLTIPCQAEASADRRPVASLARTFNAKAKSTQAGTTIESSVDVKAASAAYKRMQGWYAACAEPRYQLMFTESVKGIGDEATLFAYRDWANNRAVTYGVARTGNHTAAVTVKTEGKSSATAAKTSTMLGTAVHNLCSMPNAGACVETKRPRATVAPIPTGKAPGLINVTDVPPANNISDPWEATEAKAAKSNPAKTRCDNTEFNAKGMSGAQTRSFLVTETKKKLADTFGLTETVGKFSSAKEAQAFNSGIRTRLDACGKKELGSHVTLLENDVSKNQAVTVWYIRVELNEDTSIFYRMAAIRRGSNVAQMSFVPDGNADISNSDFVALAKRAAYRLDYL